MMYISLGLMLPAFWFGAWWLIAPIVFAVGWLTVPRGGVSFAFGVGLAWSALAFVRAGEHGSIIFRRMSAMLSLPYPWMLFVLLTGLGFLTAWLWFKAGAAFAKKQTKVRLT